MNIKMASKHIGLMEMADGSLVHIEQRKDKFIAGGMTNAGIIEEYEFELDEYCSLGENLRAFFEYVTEENSKNNQ